MTFNRFVLGATVGASDYINALRLRRLLTAAVDAALEKYDVLLSAIALSTSCSPLGHLQNCPALAEFVQIVRPCLHQYASLVFKFGSVVSAP